MANVRSVTSTISQAARTAELCDKALGYPKPGVNIGGGIHVIIPVTFSDGAPGWSTFRAAASGATFTAASGLCWVSANSSPATLTPAERTELISLLQPARRASSRFSVRAW